MKRIEIYYKDIDRDISIFKVSDDWKMENNVAILNNGRHFLMVHSVYPAEYTTYIDMDEIFKIVVEE